MTKSMPADFACHLALDLHRRKLNDLRWLLSDGRKRSIQAAHEIQSELVTMGEGFEATLQQTVIDLYTVSSGLETFLKLLYLAGADRKPIDPDGLHALLAPLKRQLDESFHDISTML
ncbi:DUF1484 family protein [Pandoraea sputorum]|uniref:Uncharacterized protein n=1 Tax=Pandoraea sputorum TaxID=93222 RepID=A0A5E5B2Y3_9BURK|nr:DUF1484 family protein [Pandoraea sputorum]VVE80249.1 hypothetical protein PSP31121_02667 [Pandoraea sputorum]